MMNGGLMMVNNMKSIEEKRKEDAYALAELILSIYEESKAEKDVLSGE
jgi:hypothetical protein